jgi:hypothetical protein
MDNKDIIKSLEKIHNVLWWISLWLALSFFIR